MKNWKDYLPVLILLFTAAASYGYMQSRVDTLHEGIKDVKESVSEQGAKVDMLLHGMVRAETELSSLKTEVKSSQETLQETRDRVIRLEGVK